MDVPGPPRRRWWTPLGLALLCAHCTIGGALVAASALGLATLPTVAGVPLAWVLPFAVVFGAFGIWLWTGRAAADDALCEIAEVPR